MSDATRRASLLLFCILFSCTACVTARTKGDRAYEDGNYNEALDYYEELIKGGTRDPEVFHRAAIASVAIGNFSVAERYYSQALRYGGGLPVARELGEFYIRTSNYASAVRVYQFLLAREEDSQAVYNNLGTALMYAGKPFDAESYLMIAQQMEPGDPLPYLNIGLLYDRHLRQPWVAINFYECFAQLDQGAAQSKEVRQRVRELKTRWGQLYDPTILECGTAYAPRAAEKKGNLKDLLADVGEEEKSIEVGDPDSPVKPVEVDRMVEELPPQPEVRIEARPEVAQRIARADEAFEKRRYLEVVQELSELPLTRLDRVHRERLGASLLELGRLSEAVSWLELALSAGDEPSTVELLISAYRQNSQEERILEICSKYAYKMEYREATKTCPKEALNKNNLLEGARRLDEDGNVKDP